MPQFPLGFFIWQIKWSLKYTLTKEHPEVGKIFTFGEVELKNILTYAAIAEQRLTHPIAHAICQKAEQAGLLLSPIDLENAYYQIGYGITVLYESDTIHLGSVRFIKMQGIYIPEKIEEKANVSISLNGASSVATDLAQMILMNDGLSGINYLFEISKELKNKSKQTLFICSTYGVTTFIAGTVFHIGLIFPLTVGTANYMIGLAHATLPSNGKS